MKRALEKFEDFNNKIKIDGQKIFDYNQQTFFVKKGDSSSVSIASHQYWQKLFEINLCVNMQQITLFMIGIKIRDMEQKHFLAIKRYGLSPLHRKVFLKT